MRLKSTGGFAAVSLATLATFVLAMTLDHGARAQNSIKAGVLTCNVESGWGFVFGSSRALKCNYDAGTGKTERYTGSIAKYGVDIGYTSNGVMIWTVLAPTANLEPGALAGDYGGGTGSAAFGVGVGANALFGGSKKSVALQPVSIEGMTGLNVAGGIAALSLKAE
jgi:hypothetical protein